MSHHRFGHVLLAGLMAVLVLGTSAAAGAAQPDIVRFQNQGVDHHLIDCGTFFINGQFEERGSVTTFYDDEGNPVRLKIQVVFNAQLTNETTGKAIHITDRFTIFEDVQTGTVTIVGLPVYWTIPGGERVALNAGKIVFDPATGEILFEAGPHSVFHMTAEELLALHCAPLADP